MTGHSKFHRQTPANRVTQIMPSRQNRKIFLFAISAPLFLAGIATTVAGPSIELNRRFAQAQTPTPAQPAAPATSPAPPVSQRTETINYDNWTVTCREAIEGPTKGKKACSALLQVADQNKKNIVFIWLIGRNTAGALLTVAQVPTGVLIQNGVELKIGSGKARVLSYNNCSAQNCEATVVMDEPLIKELIAGQGAAVTATIYAVNGQAINFNFSTKGIEKAIGSIGR
jgi:invasion protein IalB